MQIVDYNNIREKYGNDSLNFVGGKNASLANMITDINKLNIRVPAGFAITTTFYNDFISNNNIDLLINKLDKMTDNFEDLAKEIRNRIENSNFEDEFIYK